jgi:hypothetical protein
MAEVTGNAGQGINNLFHVSEFRFIRSDAFVIPKLFPRQGRS